MIMVLSAASCSEVQGSPLGAENADSVIIPASSAASSEGSDPQTPAETVSSVDSKTKRLDTMRGFTLDFPSSYLISETDEFLRIYPKSSKDEKEGVFIHRITSPLSEDDFSEQVLKANLDNKGQVSKYGEYKKSILKSGVQLFSHEGIIETSLGEYATKFVYFNLGTQTQIIEMRMASDTLTKLSPLNSILESIVQKEADLSSGEQ